MAGLGESAYSFSLTTFSPSGQLGQVQCALHAVERGNDAIGIKCKEGVILATEKRLDTPLKDETTFFKCEQLCKGVGMVYAGIGPDYRVLVRQGRKKAQAYKGVYGNEVPCSQLTRDMAGIMQEYTQFNSVRPFGVGLLVAGYDGNEPQLYQVDPSGCYFGWKATAIGRNYTAMKAFLEKRYSDGDDLSLENVVNIALLTLRDVAESKLTPSSVEIAQVTNDGKFRRLTEDEIKDALLYLD